jgi:hypothetical protein
MSNIVDASPRHAAADDFKFVSTLEEGRQRFLARALEHGLKRGRRTAGDFLRHFPPSAIMKGLEHNAELRAFILASTTGIKEKIALKKSWEDAASDLKLAFDERETSAEAIVELFSADDRIRYLDAQKLWQFLSEGEFWNTADANASIVREHLAYLLESALDEELLDQRDVVEAITVPELANRLPRDHLGALLRCALQSGENRRTFTAVELLGTAGPRILVQYVPLTHLWNAVVRPRIARRHGYEAAPESSSLSNPANPPVERSERTFSYQDEPEEITRVMPSPTFPDKLGAGAPTKPLRDAPPKSAARAGAQRPTREDPFDDAPVEGDIVMIEDTAKAI